MRVVGLSNTITNSRCVRFYNTERIVDYLGQLQGDMGSPDVQGVPDALID